MEKTVSRLSPDQKSWLGISSSLMNIMDALIVVPVCAILIVAKIGIGLFSRPRLLLVLTPILAVGFLTRPAAAQSAGPAGASGDVFRVFVGGSVSHDSNLFRLTNSANPKSDTINATGVGLRIDKPYSRQRFQLDVSETATRYNKFSYLNFDALNYRGAWLWNLGPRLSGTLSADRSKALAPFEDTLGNQRNVSITKSHAFNIDGWAFGGWHLLLGVSQSDQKSEQTILNQPDFHSVSSEAGVRYIAPSGNAITATQRSTRGDYLNQIVAPTVLDNGYKQNESEIQANWTISGRSLVAGRLAWLERKNHNLVQPKFSGEVGNFSYIWTPTENVSLNVSAARSIGPLQDPSFSHIVSDTLSFAPTWKVSPKTAVHLSFARTNSAYRGTGLVPATGPPRRDIEGRAELGAEWLPIRSLSLNASLQRQSRSSNNALVEYGATITRISASFMF